ncbi:hypothetical protein NKF06_07675 [Haloferax sp. AB510]|nr:hypothetical protein [Haloferax sp. AB510]MCO8266464.1 hypothetical protein [Haloferax sp. AB510]
MRDRVVSPDCGFSAATTERKRGVAVANAVAVAVEGDRLLAVVEYRS